MKIRTLSSIVTPAPGDLLLVQEFVNTADLVRKTDELKSPRDVAGWLAVRNLATPGAVVTAAELALALELREGLRTLAAANNGAAHLGEALERLGRAVDKTRFRVAFDPSGAVRLVPASTNFNDVIGLFAEIVATAQVSGEWPRLKACAHVACRAVFYDTSANRSGKWCSKRRCGNRMSSSAYRRRHHTPFVPSWLGRPAAGGDDGDGVS